MNRQTYMEEFEIYLKSRLEARKNARGGNLTVTMNQVMTIRPNKRVNLRASPMAKSAWYYEDLFKGFSLGESPRDIGNIVRAAIEFAILRLIATIIQPSANVQKNSKLLKVYFEFFLAQSSYVFLSDQQRHVQEEPKINQNFQGYLNFLQNIPQIEALHLAQFDDTFNATLAELEPLVIAIVHDNNPNDGLYRFELIQDAACHVHKHNIRDVYVDMFKIDKRFINANDYLTQANDTKTNGQQLKKANSYHKSYQLEFIENDQYIHHWRITHIKEKTIGRRPTVYYLGSYFKTVQAQIN